MNRKVVSRRQVILYRRRMILATIISFSIAFLLAAFLFTLTTKASESSPRAKYYTSIELHQGDTIWDLADIYMTNEYHSKEEYVQEVKEINHLTSDKIYADSYLVLPYYDEISKH